MIKMPLLKTIIIFILTHSLCLAQDCLTSKLLAAIIYIEHSNEIKLELKKTFTYLKKDINKKFSFKINDKLNFIPIYFFSHKVRRENIQISDELLRNEEKYKMHYSFDEYSVKVLSSFPTSSSTNIILNFSQPINNYLIVEFLDSRANISKSLKMGPALQILFVFGSEGQIIEVYSNSTIYN